MRRMNSRPPSCRPVSYPRRNSGIQQCSPISQGVFPQPWAAPSISYLPSHTKRFSKTERATQTFKRHFIFILAGTHPSFPINFWHELIPQAEITLNMMHAFNDQPNVSAWCKTSDNFGHIGFYLGPAASHYRAHRCMVQETNLIRISDSIILNPAPLVVPGVSRFDQLLALTDNIYATAENPSANDSRAQPLEALALLLRTFLAADNHRSHSTSCPRLWPYQASTIVRYRQRHHGMALQRKVTRQLF
jgi:hypothetical protein